MSDGGKTISAYRIWYDQGLGVWAVLIQEVTTNSYTMTSPVTQGTAYTFKVQALNSVGYSDYSNEVTILAGQIPDKPSAPQTSIDGSNVQVTWLAPNNRGSPITRYYIKFIQYDGVSYAEDMTDCLGTDATIISSLSCQIPIATLITNPFSLPWGSSIFAKIIATNSYGDSEASDPGNGAIILTNPDAPINLQDVPGITNANQIGISWELGASQGGTPVLDYTVLYDHGGANGIFVTLASGVT